MKTKNRFCVDLKGENSPISDRKGEASVSQYEKDLKELQERKAELKDQSDFVAQMRLKILSQCEEQLKEKIKEMKENNE